MLKSKVFSPIIYQTLSLFVPWNQNSVTRFHFCFIYINPRPCCWHLCIYMSSKKKKKIEQVVCPITTAHGGTGGPLAARHVRGPCAFGSGPGSSFWRSYAVATQGGLVVSFNMTIMYCTLSKFLLLLLYFIIVSNILRYSRTTVYIFLTLENK